VLNVDAPTTASNQGWKPHLPSLLRYCCRVAKWQITKKAKTEYLLLY